MYGILSILPLVRYLPFFRNRLTQMDHGIQMGTGKKSKTNSNQSVKYNFTYN